MRIGIDNISPGQSTGKHAPGGMRKYLQSLISEFAIQAPHHHFFLFTPSWADPLLEPMPPNFEVINLPYVPVNRPLRIFYQQTILPAIVAHYRLDVFFCTATIAPLLAKVPLVLAVQFIQFYKIPEAYGKLRTAYLRIMLPLSLKKVKKAIIFTESSKRDLVRWTGVPAQKVYVVPHGLSKDVWKFSEVSRNILDRQVGLDLTKGKPYILYVSSTYGYKNHARLIRAFGLLKKRTKLPHVLLLVGSEVSISFDELLAIAEQAGIIEYVIFTGRLDHHIAAATYLSADLSVFPTLYETFGFPLLEAMACGCPVATSNIGSMSELSGDSAVLFDPLDENSIANGMEQILCDQSLRQSLIILGKQRAKEYTWESSAYSTLKILEEATRGP